MTYKPTTPRPKDRVQDRVADFRRELAERQAAAEAAGADYLRPIPTPKKRIHVLKIGILIILIIAACL